MLQAMSRLVNISRSCWGSTNKLYLLLLVAGFWLFSRLAFGETAFVAVESAHERATEGARTWVQKVQFQFRNFPSQKGKKGKQTFTSRFPAHALPANSSQRIGKEGPLQSGGRVPYPKVRSMESRAMQLPKVDAKRTCKARCTALFSRDN